MSVISIRLPETLLHALDAGAHMLHIQRAEYIRRAIEHMNKEIMTHEREKKLGEVSLRVRQESMRVNQEFSDLDDVDGL